MEIMLYSCHLFRFHYKNIFKTFFCVTGNPGHPPEPISLLMYETSCHYFLMTTFLLHTMYPLADKLADIRVELPSGVSSQPVFLASTTRI